MLTLNSASREAPHSAYFRSIHFPNRCSALQSRAQDRPSPKWQQVGRIGSKIHLESLIPRRGELWQFDCSPVEEPPTFHVWRNLGLRVVHVLSSYSFPQPWPAIADLQESKLLRCHWPAGTISIQLNKLKVCQVLPINACLRRTEEPDSSKPVQGSCYSCSFHKFV